MSQKNRNPSVDISGSAASQTGGRPLQPAISRQATVQRPNPEAVVPDHGLGPSTADRLPSSTPSSSTEELVHSVNEHLLYLYESGQLCDVFLTTEDGTRLGLHRVVLASCSEQYRQQLQDEPSAAPTDIPVRSVSPEILDGVIRFMYTGQLSMTEGNVQEVMSAAQQLGLPRLLEHAQRQLLDRYDEATVLRYLPLAQRHGLPTLQTDMLSYAGRQFAAVSHSPDFLRLGVEDVRALLSDQRSREGVGEVELLRAAVRWLQAADVAVRHQQAVSVLECVRLQLVSPNDLLEVLERGSPGLADMPEVGAMLCRAYRYHAINAGAGAGTQ